MFKASALKRFSNAITNAWCQTCAQPLLSLTPLALQGWWQTIWGSRSHPRSGWKREKPLLICRFINIFVFKKVTFCHWECIIFIYRASGSWDVILALILEAVEKGCSLSLCVGIHAKPFLKCTTCAVLQLRGYPGKFPPCPKMPSDDLMGESKSRDLETQWKNHSDETELKCILTFNPRSIGKSHNRFFFLVTLTKQSHEKLTLKNKKN